MPATRYTLEVQPIIPKPLERLPELAQDLLYSWDRHIRALFFRLDRALWESCGHNPKLVLRRVAQTRLLEAAQDPVFMEEYHRALSVFDTYHMERTRPGVAALDGKRDLVAYFCAEFGFYESLQIYSGGLGILAADHCKAASDLGIPFIAVGLLYRQGYFTQTIDGYGNQIAHYTPTNFSDLPIIPAVTGDGSDLRVHIALPGRQVAVKVWIAVAGHIKLYLLDSDLAENSEQDRSITYQLYGGDTNTRMQQELVLGVGGVRALRALGLAPTVWHLNEGHSAFQILERCREYVQRGFDFDSAIEAVAASTVFTTHTPVTAGHDIFDHALISSYFPDYVRELGIDMDRFQELGTNPSNQGGFNMTVLALRGSRLHNGVSRIHGAVTSRIEGYMWPQIPHEENPIGYVTNGVHVPTFLAREWANLLDMRFGSEWRNELVNKAYWDRIDEIPNHSYWSLRQSLKSEMLEAVHQRVTRQYQRNGYSAPLIERLTRNLSRNEANPLVLGFARRFATYKRATLLFENPERLARLLNNPDRPVLLIFAGKAHPHDLPGQQLIQVIHEVARRPEFEGKIVLAEGYDLSLARKFVSGVDVWINTPEYPLEASGTSGQKAAINGVINLSVLDGWWGEGYDGHNGWAISPHNQPQDAVHRRHEEAKELMDILEHSVIPLYFEQDGRGYSERWVKMSKASMKSILPRFNSERMVLDYVHHYYAKASQQGRALTSQGGAPARELAQWKKRIAQSWHDVRIGRPEAASEAIRSGEILPLKVSVHLGALSVSDVIVECLVGSEEKQGQQYTPPGRFALAPAGTAENGDTVFHVDLKPALPGLQYYRFRVYPYHPLLSHPFETGNMLWL
ncbi:MAG: alpha-glucan family phosphorylase [Acidiferrobacteraceae bacterium]